MDYTDAIIRRLRDRLLRYRSDSRIGGRKRPWLRVAQDIADAESVPRAFYDDEEDFNVLGEALRRFAAGLQVPAPARLDAIAAFLQEKRYLTADDFAEDSAGAQDVRGLLQLFGRQEAEPLPMDLCGSFIAARAWRSGRHEYRLLSISKVSGALVIEETLHHTNARAHSASAAELSRFFKVACGARIKSDGWLIPADDAHWLLWLRDRATGAAHLESLIYVERNEDSEEPPRVLHILHHKRLHDPRVMRARRPPEGPTTDRGVAADWIVDNLWRFDRLEP